MKQRPVIQPKPAYETPTIEELGSFAGLTLGGSKWSGWSDLQSGQPSNGPGS